MNYKETEEETLDLPESTNEDSTEQIPEQSPDSLPSKLIQIILDPETDEPRINYTSNLSIAQVLGALSLATETLISINVHDKLHKRRMLKAFEDV